MQAGYPRYHQKTSPLENIAGANRWYSRLFHAAMVNRGQQNRMARHAEHHLPYCTLQTNVLGLVLYFEVSQPEVR